MIDTIRAIVAPLHKRVMNMIARSVVTLIDDSTKMQLLQLSILDDETRAGLERFQNYGFTSVPKAGAEAVVAFVGGTRDHGLVIAVDDRRYRLRNLASGEVAMYDQTGSKFVFKSNGDAEITPSSGKVKVIGDLDVSGTVTATTDVVGGSISLKNHKHSVSGTAPGGGAVVFTPSSSTGVPT